MSDDEKIIGSGQYGKVSLVKRGDYMYVKKTFIIPLTFDDYLMDELPFDHFVERLYTQMVANDQIKISTWNDEANIKATLRSDPIVNTEYRTYLDKQKRKSYYKNLYNQHINELPDFQYYIDVMKNEKKFY